MPPVEMQGRPTGSVQDEPSYNPHPMGLASNAAMPPKPLTHIRDIQITQLDHGYVVYVGCQRFAIENPSILLTKLAEYIRNPAETEQKWQDKKLF